MIFRIQLKRLSVIISVVFLLILSFITFSFGESVFLKDGNILEGKITKENDKKITIVLAEEETREIERKDIIRTVYHSNYKDKRYLTKMDGTVLEVYIVDEDKTGYTYRLKLDSADEIRIAKDDVDGISKRKVVIPVAREETREEKLTTRAPRIRIGLTTSGPLEATSDYAETEFGAFDGALIDLFLYRMRNENGNGIDFFVRGVANIYEIKDYRELGLGYDTVPTGYEFNKSELLQLGLGCGLRYNRGTYLAGLLWQIYLIGYYQYSTGQTSVEYNYTGTLGSGYSNKIIDREYTSHGFIGGVGIEVGLFQYLGLFCEYTYGYSKISYPEKDENLEGGAIRFGVSLRTSFL